jgi:hypothetical protein
VTRYLVLLAATPILGLPQSPDLPPGVVELGRVKQTMERALSRFSNYTCLQVIERWRAVKGAKLRQTDTVKLEVAFIDGKELYSWPGSRQFDERKIGDIVQGGTIASGMFVAFARTVFTQNWPTFQFRGEEALDGQPALRWDYAVPLLGSGFTLTVGQFEAKVAFAGSFWTGPASPDVRRLVVRAVDIPPHLGMSDVMESIDYARVDVSGVSMLMPARAETETSVFTGERTRNTTTFTQWREYKGDTKLSFDISEPDGTTAPALPSRTVLIPPGLPVAIRTEAAIEVGSAVIGDPVHGHVDRAVRAAGQILIPAGARLAGRIRWVEKNRSDTRSLIGVEFHQIEFDGAIARFFASIEEVVDASGAALLWLPHGTAFQRQESGRMIRERRTESFAPVPDMPGVGFLSVRGIPGQVRKGTVMLWRTATP